MLYSCPNHELSKEMIIQFFYAWLYLSNRSMLDTSCTGSFMMKTIEFKWDLLERIKCNYEDQDLDEGKESGITPKFDCVKYFMDTDAFHGFTLNMDLTLRQQLFSMNILLLTLISLRISGLNRILPLK